MVSPRSLRDGLADESLRVAILIGLATVPVTVASAWGPVADSLGTVGDSVSDGALLLAGVLTGYYYSSRPTETRYAGIWTGRAGSIGLVLVFCASVVAAIVSDGGLGAAIAVILSPVVIGLIIVFTVLVTMLTAVGTDWVVTRLDRSRRLAASDAKDGTERTDGSPKRRLVLAGYAVLTPIALGYLVIQSASGAGIVISTLAVIVVTVFSFAALGILFIDATEPRAVRTGWLPNVWLYAGGPIVAGVLGYLIATVQGWGYPPGYGQYSFSIALWLATIAYLANSHRRGSRRRPAGSSKS
ncbi:hypothetical protein [Halopiger xanaduensis]|uniref:Uncharacterized protein n=1 Tax=Halopiger xanaduensis (strain DSM 18323 / JCM 14033 / SH-6) TaxID=797210 RepID=F8DCN1_HALXS|nr:hypothetical protein [Halopiger xanaduensis]AEH36075.1 hypothetical protein Halxa_1442 [Halopiger xanaduensis SH-6]